MKKSWKGQKISFHYLISYVVLIFVTDGTGTAAISLPSRDLESDFTFAYTCAGVEGTTIGQLNVRPAGTVRPDHFRCCPGLLFREQTTPLLGWRIRYNHGMYSCTHLENNGRDARKTGQSGQACSKNYDAIQQRCHSRKDLPWPDYLQCPKGRPCACASQATKVQARARRRELASSGEFGRCRGRAHWSASEIVG
jgi:hypothetical protein